MPGLDWDHAEQFVYPDNLHQNCRICYSTIHYCRHYQTGLLVKLHNRQTVRGEWVRTMTGSLENIFQFLIRPAHRYSNWGVPLALTNSSTLMLLLCKTLPSWTDIVQKCIYFWIISIRPKLQSLNKIRKASIQKLCTQNWKLNPFPSGERGKSTCIQLSGQISIGGNQKMKIPKSCKGLDQR